MNIPRAEHPKPQFYRRDWMNLNGQWQFEIDQSRSGQTRGLFNEGIALKDTILVPFCPESCLSGVGHTDFMNGVWYKRTITLGKPEGRVVLHFGAVDYRCTAYVNGQKAGEHKGGFVSFSFDVTSLVREGENEITVYAEDDSRDRLIPSGKQSDKFESYGCFYTRTTGIWQTVWLEFTPAEYIRAVKYYPNIADSSVTMQIDLCGISDLEVAVSFDGAPMGGAKVSGAAGHVSLTVPLAEKHLWELGKGRLYDVKFTFGRDEVDSYFGLRQVRMDGMKFLLNEQNVFQRTVLDQGFYPDGIYTAPTDAALVRDIEISMGMGFNGARLHEKIFEERFLYHADRLGYMVWGEFPNWGLDASYADAIHGILGEWVEEMERDFNHPSIIGWCPYNETYRVHDKGVYDSNIDLIYRTTKALDPTRPCIDTSGGYHVNTDIYDIHDYTQEPEEFSRKLADGTMIDKYGQYQRYGGQPCFFSEYGGTSFGREGDGWGYGSDAGDEQVFMARFRGLADALLDDKRMMGLCYTQLTDVEQEQNGLYTYDRKPKFDINEIRAILSRRAAIEAE